MSQPSAVRDDVRAALHAHRAELDAVEGVVEGSAVEDQVLAYAALVRRFDVAAVVEIGFNLGYSAVAWLAASPQVSLVSLDLAEHAYVPAAAAAIARRYPGRFELVEGDSAVTVPALAAAGRTFDLLYVDGGHEREAAARDLAGVRALARPSAIVVMDDLIPEEPWGAGPTRAWEEAIAAGWLEELERGEATAPGEAWRVESGGRRAWGVGRFASS